MKDHEGWWKMKDYDYHRPAEKVLLILLSKAEPEQKPPFVLAALTVGVIFCMIKFLPMGRSRWTSRNISGQME